MKLYEEITTILKPLSGIEAIALSGSSTALINDSLSDYDIYIYHTSPIDTKIRKSLLGCLGDGSFGESAFEEGDLIIPKEGPSADIMYRSLDWIEAQIDDVWEKCNARLGYTTCFIFNVGNSKSLFDRTGKLSSLIERCSSEYPEKLRDNIIKLNLSMIDNNHAYNFLDQIKIAVRRNDLISINHRVAVFLASYFDILFAHSRILHPGEKKLMGYIDALGVEKPECFAEDIQNILSHSCSEIDALPHSLERTVDHLEAMLKA